MFSSLPAGFSIEGPSQAKIDCNDNGDGSADVTYWPTMPGEYAVHILCNEQDIPKSPYMAEIKPTADFNASRVSSLLAVPYLHCFFPAFLHRRGSICDRFEFPCHLSLNESGRQKLRVGIEALPAGAACKAIL